MRESQGGLRLLRGESGVTPSATAARRSGVHAGEEVRSCRARLAGERASWNGSTPPEGHRAGGTVDERYRSQPARLPPEQPVDRPDRRNRKLLHRPVTACRFCRPQNPSCRARRYASWSSVNVPASPPASGCHFRAAAL